MMASKTDGLLNDLAAIVKNMEETPDIIRKAKLAVGIFPVVGGIVNDINHRLKALETRRGTPATEEGGPHGQG